MYLLSTSTRISEVCRGTKDELLIGGLPQTEINKRSVAGGGEKILVDENCNEPIPSANNQQLKKEDTDITSTTDNLNYRYWRPKFEMLKSSYRIVVCVITGIVFGWAMEKGRGESNALLFLGEKRGRAIMITEY